MRPLSLSMKSLTVIFQTNAIEEYFPEVLFVMSSDFVDEILKCN